MKGVVDTGRLKPNQGRTNQKLYFARLQLDQMERVMAAQDSFAWEAEALSCREAAILHLHGAYLAFLQELVRFYKLSGPLLTTEALRTVMAVKGQVSPEVSVLQTLEQDRDSWLATLLRAHADCLSAPDAPVAAAPDDEDEGLGQAISLVTVTTDEPLSRPDRERLARWHHELTTIIREFRREMAEW